MENRKLKILAIDDNQDNLISLKALIREAFPQALMLTATDAGKGIEQAQVENPDAILLDVVMPGMDGFEACQQLKANPLTRHIPVVFLTAIKGDREARIRALEVGAEAFLSKPIDEVELTAQIRAMQKIKAASEHERAEKVNLTDLVAVKTRELELAHTSALNLLEDLRKENEARRESEERFQSLYNNITIGLYRTFPDGKIILANPCLIKMLGYSSFEELAERDLEKDGFEPTYERKHFLEQMNKEGEVIGFESAWVSKHRKPIFIRENAIAIRDANGNILYYDGTVEDITARKLAEDAQRETSLRLQESVRAANVGLWDWDLATHCVHYSSEWKRQIGYADAELGDAFEEWECRVHPEDLAPTLERVREAIAGDNRRYQAEFRFRHKDGSYRWIVAQCSVLRAENGKAVRVVGSHIDLTESRHMEEALRESEAHLRLLFENLPSGVVVHAADTVVLFANPEALRLLGLTLEQMRGKTATDPAWCFLREDGGSLALEDYPVNRVRSSGKTLAGQIIGIRLPGQAEPNWVQFSAYTQLDASGQISQVIVAFTDITERKRAEAKIEQEGMLSNTIIDSIPGTFYLLDEHGHYVRWNPYQREVIIGKPQDQIAGMSAVETIHPEDRDLIQARIANVLRDGKEETVVGRVLLHGGPAFIWMMMTGRRMMIEGRPFLVGTGIDISERKQAEAAVLRSEALQGKMISNIGDVIVIIDANGINRYKSKNIEKFFGWKPEEVVGQSALANVHTDDLNAVQAFITNLLKTPDATGDIEVRYRCKDGRYKWISFTGCNLMHDPDINGILGKYHDITERKRAEAERQRLSMAMEQANDAVVVTDHEGAIQYVNPAFEKVTGYTRQESLGMNPSFIKSGKQDAAFYRRMWAMLAAGETWSGHMINKRKDGTLYEEDASISPIRDALGNIVNFVAVKRDVTHEIQLEEQLQQAQKMESVGRLAGGVAHDFNNLLMGIMGFTDLCRDMIEPGHPMREYLDEITSSAQRSAEITRQLLAFARKQTIAPIALDLNDAVVGMLKLLLRLIGEDIKLTWKPGADLRPVKLDPSQLDQILANLCVNARDAIGGVGEVVLETGSTSIDAEYCAIHPEAIPGMYAILAVSDNGCGMDKATLAQIFEPFFTTKGIGKGTGLGLATVYGIVKQNNGFVNVYSEPGKGTTFRIHLPMISDENVATTVTSKPAAPRGQWETILLVEDDASVRTTCGLFLLASNYKVLTAESPEQALVIAGRTTGDIQLLLTDVVMPGMDGRQLAKRIREDRPDIKVLFMSGYTADVIARRGVLDEGVQFISKPFSHDDLTRKLRQVLDTEGCGDA